MRYIEELREGENVNDIYFCKVKQILKTKAGKSYYSMTLQDKTGTIDAKVWDLSNAIEHFEAMEYISVVGQITSFQGNLQLNISRIRRASEGEYSVDDYMPMTKKNREEMYKEVVELVESVKEEHLQKLLKMFFVEDKEWVKRFVNHSAAKAVHHGFIGGLLEHTLGVAKMCDYMANNYPIINRDLLITAALFHDIGKLDELASFPENDYTDEGNFLGHIYMGTEKVGEKIRMIPGFPTNLALELKHCILAHHGELEFGSPKKPAIVEAMALNFADNADAKLETFTEVINGAKEEETWLGYNRFFESNIRRS